MNPWSVSFCVTHSSAQVESNVRLLHATGPASFNGGFCPQLPQALSHLDTLSENTRRSSRWFCANAAGVKYFSELFLGVKVGTWWVVSL